MVMMVIATPIILIVSVAVLPAGGGGVSKVGMVPVRGVTLGSAWTGRIVVIVVAAVRGVATDAVANGATIGTVGVGAVGGANDKECNSILPMTPA